MIGDLGGSEFLSGMKEQAELELQRINVSVMALFENLLTCVYAGYNV